MKARIVFTDDSFYEEKELILDDVVEVHYCYPSFVKEPQTAFEQKTTGQTIYNKYIKEFEIKEDEAMRTTISKEKHDRISLLLRDLGKKNPIFNNVNKEECSMTELRLALCIDDLFQLILEILDLFDDEV